MEERIGPGGMMEKAQQEATQWSQLLPQLPRLAHAALARLARPASPDATMVLMQRLADEQRRTRRWLVGMGLVALLLLALHLLG